MKHKYRKPLENWPSGHVGWNLSDDLSRCPFCDGRAEYAQNGNEFSKRMSITVRCGNCRVQRTDAVIRNGIEWLLETAFKNWNQTPRD